MLKEHPKGLLVAFFSNMGERFGFYTMMAILVLFLQAKYGLTESQAGEYYSWFYFGIYALALIGGILADATRKYKFVILMGIVIMFAGYVVMAIPGNPLAITLTGLFTIALGNGLFKGNLQAVVGQMYDNPAYSKVRDTAFMIFYMGINIGAFFAPFVATGIRNWFLRTQGFEHDGSLPAMCHAYTNGTLEDVSKFQELANSVSGSVVSDLGAFANDYINAFAKGYNYAFGIAAIAMVISLLVYIVFNKLLPSVEKVAKTDNDQGKAKTNIVSFLLAAGLMVTTSVIFYFAMDDVALGAAVGLFVGFVAMMFQISTKEERPRVTSLILVFFVVIFFWMSFHQNGLTLTFFARDYTVKEVGPFTNIFFKLESILAFIGAVAGVILLLFNKKNSNRLIGGAMTLVFGALTWYFISRSSASNPIAPEVFQSFNPLFIVSLTFPVMAVFTWLQKKNMEPSTPKKIGIGMIIAAIGFVVILVASVGLVSPHELQFVENGVTKYNPVPDSSRVVPYWLISSYLILTIAELFLSPMGLSFVSKVAPARFQGLMQGGWLLATAVGNKFLFVGSKFWGQLDLWQLWAIFIVCCILSAVFIFSIMKRLEAATK
ncbi:MFS transporter [Lentimicrobium sp.]|jgi:POT family proton-dependent oligopeptide transporter|uniref:peptide MFS transporter n=1 Tax=Lentimicrobium sp. TaxID=2034841 RepID=UPI0025F292A0|nr:MFS transporter [Lentimicrobium sp.]MCO5258202.1 MFS transporter [Lentimicrobium sp.]MCO5264076.1 MFS transporter [Lentimicrobium sp.]HPF63594.1 MFS transporter [Lentimicrobium sp.]HPJ62286.1 MFS transporter [Lentimicrobium sp.]HPR25490.1 MFS transporter [Lentimicrobium sp.]